MATRTSPDSGPRHLLVTGSRYQRAWVCAVGLAAAAWTLTAMLQTPWLPLLLLTAMNAGWGGLLVAFASGSRAGALRRCAAGTLTVAGTVLVLAGFRHHIELAGATVAVLTASSPHVIRWIAGS